MVLGESPEAEFYRRGAESAYGRPHYVWSGTESASLKAAYERGFQEASRGAATAQATYPGAVTFTTPEQQLFWQAPVLKPGEEGFKSTTTKSAAPEPVQSRMPSAQDVQTGTKVVGGVSYKVYMTPTGKPFLGEQVGQSLIIPETTPQASKLQPLSSKYEFPGSKITTYAVDESGVSMRVGVRDLGRSVLVQKGLSGKFDVYQEYPDYGAKVLVAQDMPFIEREATMISMPKMFGTVTPGMTIGGRYATKVKESGPFSGTLSFLGEEARRIYEKGVYKRIATDKSFRLYQFEATGGAIETGVTNVPYFTQIGFSL